MHSHFYSKGLIAEPPQQGLCIPSTCTDEAIMDAYNQILNTTQVGGQFSAKRVYSSDKNTNGTLTVLDKICM